MRQLFKIMIILWFGFGSFYSQAEQALYKSMPLNNIHKLSLQGNIKVELMPSDKQRAEIYLRKSAINNVIINKKEIKKVNNNQSVRYNLVIREQPAGELAINEDQALAVVKLYLSQVNTINIDELHHLNVHGDFTEAVKSLHIKSLGDSRAALNVKIDKLSIDIHNSSEIDLTNLVTNKFKLKQKHKSNVNVSRSKADNMDIHLQNHANLNVQSSQVNNIKLKTSNASVVAFSSQNQVDHANIETYEKSEVNFTDQALQHATVNAKNDSQVHLGSINALSANAKNTALITYLSVDESLLTTKALNSARIQKAEGENE